MSAPARPILVDYVTTIREDTQMITNETLVICLFHVEFSNVLVKIIKVKERIIICAGVDHLDFGLENVQGLDVRILVCLARPITRLRVLD